MMNEEERRHRRRLAQKEEHMWRMKTLRREAAEFWIDILERTEPIARDIPRKRACSYIPWQEALHQIASTNRYWSQQPIYELTLMGFANCVSRPTWPEEHAHLVDFTLRFLEADVMLFRSGYAKKHLLRRLRQVTLSASQTERVHALLRRAVTEGTGLEEFREFCRLAAKTVSDDLRLWLNHQAEGVLIPLEDRFGPGLFHWAEKLGEDVFDRLGTVMFGERLFAADPPHTIVKISDVPEDNRVKLNAWRMLQYIQRTET